MKKNRSAAKSIALSWGRMLEILFKPFSLKKWIGIGVIVMLAGNFGGMNFNVQLPGKSADTQTRAALTARGAHPQISPLEVKEKLKELFAKSSAVLKTDRPFLIAASFAVISGIITILLWLFIKAVFSFAFIETVVRNDLSMKIAYHNNKRMGASLFWWNTLYGLLSLCALLAIFYLPMRALWDAGVFAQFPDVDMKHVLALITPYAVTAVASFLGFLLIDLMLNDFVLVIMYARRCGIIKGLRGCASIILRHGVSVVQYIILKLLLFIPGIIGGIILLMAGLLSCGLFLAALGGIGFLVLTMTPPASKMIASMILTAVGIPLAGCAIFFCILTIFLPVHLFFRLFSIYFVGSIDKGLETIAAMGALVYTDEEKKAHAKPLAMVWSAVLMTIVCIACVVLAVFLGGTAIAKASPRAADWSMTAQPSSPAAPPSAAAPTVSIKQLNSVRIKLKNGGSIEGEIISTSQTSTTLRLPGGTAVINNSDIVTIER